MFFARPKIRKLGWNLEGPLLPYGSKNHHGRTIDGKPIDVRFSSGYLSVKIGPEGAEPTSQEMKEILISCIAPFGTMDILPEQICDILGITIAGEKIFYNGPPPSYGIDLSGNTTYWASEHMMMLHHDATEFVDLVCETIPNVILEQQQFARDYKTSRRRSIPFIIDTDKNVLIQISSATQDSNQPLKSIPDFTAHFSTNGREVSHSSKEIVTRAGGKDLLDKVRLNASLNWGLRFQFTTDDVSSRRSAAKLVHLVNKYFYGRTQMLDLSTGRIILNTFGYNKISFSKNFYEWCLDNPTRYLKVGSFKNTDGQEVFYGIRPNKTKGLRKYGKILPFLS